MEKSAIVTMQEPAKEALYLPPSLTLCRTSRLRMDQILLDANLQPRFFLEVKSFTKGPSLILHNGDNESAPRIAAHTHHSFAQNQVCLGDWEVSRGIHGVPQWTDIDTGGGLFSSDTSKFCTFMGPSGRQFRLESSGGDKYGFSKWGKGAHPLKDAVSGDVVAIFHLLSYDGKEKCRFDWLSGVTPEEEIVCVMVMCAKFCALRTQHTNNTFAVATA